MRANSMQRWLHRNMKATTLTPLLSETSPSDLHRELTALDRCDSCGARAWVRALMSADSELLFCAHHGAKHIDALRDVSIYLQDDRTLLLEEA